MSIIIFGKSGTEEAHIEDTDSCRFRDRIFTLETVETKSSKTERETSGLKIAGS